ncbi:MAG TPA: hypothetical protein VEK55_14220 [Xanthobacteraceae bacterium]|nr:hypothetical protein [Xanthobacteraceae bacterium]
MLAISIDQAVWRARRYRLRACFRGRTVRCIATRKVPVDCLGADIWASGVDVVGAAQACRPTLEYALRNRLLAGDLNRSGGAAVMLTHDSFFHWANCFGPDPPGR